MTDYALSIIVPTARYSPILVKMIRYLRKAVNEESIEIVIASTTDNPGNKIYELLCEITRDCKLLIVERTPSRDSRSLQKNMAILASKGKYIYVIDDDATPTVRLIKNTLKVINQGACDAVLHPLIPKPISIWAKVRMIEKMYSSFDLYQSSSRILKRDLFIKLGGYKVDLVLGEDIEFQQRLLRSKPKICTLTLSEGFELHHGEYRTLKEYVRRAWYYGEYSDTLVRLMNPLITYKAYVRIPKKLVSSLRLLTFAYIIYKYTSLMSVLLRVFMTLMSKFLYSYLKWRKT